MNSATTLLLLGFLLLLLIAPFAALAPLVLVVVISALCLMGLTLFRTLLTGKPPADGAEREGIK